MIKNILERSDLVLKTYLDNFKDQKNRINQSLLTDFLSRDNRINDPKVLSSYSKSNDLIECLRSSNFDELVNRLNKISKEINLK